MRQVPIVLGLGFAILLLGGVILAADSSSPAVPSIMWWTADDGGGASTGGGFTLSGTAGQPDAGLLTGGEFTLGGGFWGGGELVRVTYETYLPLVLRNGP